MYRYYVEFNGATTGAGVYLYVMAHSPEHVREMFPLFNIVAIDQTDQIGWTDDEEVWSLLRTVWYKLQTV